MSKILGNQLVGDSNISFVAAPFISVPNTTIVNRAPVRDLANDMGVRMGIDRIAIQSIIELQNEFGPNNERVFKALNDDRDMVKYLEARKSDPHTVKGVADYFRKQGVRAGADGEAYLESVGDDEDEAQDVWDADGEEWTP